MPSKPQLAWVLQSKLEHNQVSKKNLATQVRVCHVKI
jgi:uncharacterized membrane protein YwzB